MKVNICKKCGEKIVFIPTNKGKMMPVDFNKDIKDWSVFNKDVHMTHFASCKYADEFRKKIHFVNFF